MTPDALSPTVVAPTPKADEIPETENPALLVLETVALRGSKYQDHPLLQDFL